ncbi:MAG: hypothetical protein QF724_00195 [Planctomycetota bacterium]|nr:hypothetical protein [Planctomycetota bacterium]MDP6956074.1 hypothetical protein [Planctomycetota bacterium]
MRPRGTQLPWRRRRIGRNSGFTFIEISIVTTILIFSLLTLSAATLRMHALRRQVHETTVAHNTLRAMAEQFQASSRAARDEPGTWSGNLLASFGPAGDPGSFFEASGLTPIPGETRNGTIVIVVDETTTDDDLGINLGMPRDLNGDGDASDTDVAGIARLLPIVLEVNWKGFSGIRSARHAFYLTAY